DAPLVGAWGRVARSVGGFRPEAAVAFAPCELGRERVEPLVPEPAEVVEPAIDLAERRSVDGIEPAGALGTDGGEPALAQHPEMLRHGWLRDSELRLDDLGDRSRAALAVGEQFENSAADRVTEDVERVHGRRLEGDTYISQTCDHALLAALEGLQIGRAHV